LSDEGGSVESVLTKLVRSGDIKVHVSAHGDRFSLTDQGTKKTEASVIEMLRDYPNVKDKETMTRDLGEVLGRHGILAIAGLGCELAPIEGKRRPYFWELRFRFMGGNMELCKMTGSIDNLTPEKNRA